MWSSLYTAQRWQLTGEAGLASGYPPSIPILVNGYWYIKLILQNVQVPLLTGGRHRLLDPEPTATTRSGDGTPNDPQHASEHYCWMLGGGSVPLCSDAVVLTGLTI